MRHIGIIGIGKWGSKLLNTFSLQTRVLWCASRGNAERSAPQKKNHPEIAVTDNYQEILSDKKVDAVVIATPISAHAEIVREALSAGKHVFVEKPLATEEKIAQHLVDEADKRKLSLFTDFTFLYHPCFVTLQNLLRDRRIKSVHFSWYKYGSFTEDILWGLLVHDVAMAIQLCGEPKEIKLEKTLGVITDADIVSVSGIFENDISATFSINRISPIRSKLIEIILDNGMVAWHGDTIFTYDDGSKEYRKHFTSPSPNAALENEIPIFLKSMDDPALASENTKVSLLVTKTFDKISKNGRLAT